ncbi:MAG: FAD-binding oxidoreductase [Thaumarchaeota archaeon]|nr:FAD-binding oxidoreductase [Nitrososphaerota archaeon]
MEARDEKVSRSSERQHTSRRVGVLVIGGGIIGLSIAYHLSRRGYSDVTVIEREKELASHASGHNASGLVPPRESKARDVWELHTEGLKLFKSLSEVKGFDFDYKVNGLLTVHKIGSGQKSLLRTVQELQAMKVDVNLRPLLSRRRSGQLEKTCCVLRKGLPERGSRIHKGYQCLEFHHQGWEGRNCQDKSRGLPPRDHSAGNRTMVWRGCLTAWPEASG